MKKLFKKAGMPFWMTMLIWSLVGLVVILIIIAAFNPNLRDYLFFLGGLA